jgi:hypothetical protein
LKSLKPNIRALQELLAGGGMKPVVGQDNIELDAYELEVLGSGADHAEDLLGSRVHTDPDPHFTREKQGYKRKPAQTTLDYSHIDKGII